MYTKQVTIKGNGNFFSGLKYIARSISDKAETHNKSANMFMDKLMQWVGDRAYEFFDDDKENPTTENETSELETNINFVAERMEERALFVNSKILWFINAILDFVFGTEDINPKIFKSEVEFAKKCSKFFKNIVNTIIESTELLVFQIYLSNKLTFTNKFVYRE